VYAALNVRDIDGLLLPQNTQIPRDPASENAEVLNGMQLKAFAGQQHDAHIAAHLLMGMSPMLQAVPSAGMMLQKHVLDHIRLKAEEDVEAELFKAYGTDPDRMVSDLQREGMVAMKVAIFMQETKDLQSKLSGTGQQQEDPLVALKKQELEQRAAYDQARIQAENRKIELDAQKAQATEQFNRDRLQSQQNIAMLRATQPRGGRNAA